MPTDRSRDDTGAAAERGKRRAKREPAPTGTLVRDHAFDRDGVVVDHACQYAHPQAPPMYHYLIRWEDGQLQALAEFAFRGNHGLEMRFADADG